MPGTSVRKRASFARSEPAIAPAAISAFTLRALVELSLATGDMTGKYPISSKSFMIFGFTFLIFPTRPNLASSLNSTSSNWLSLPVIPTAGSPAAIKSLTTERSTLPVRTNSTTSIISGVVIRKPLTLDFSIPRLASSLSICGPPPWTMTNLSPNLKRLAISLAHFLECSPMA